MIRLLRSSPKKSRPRQFYALMKQRKAPMTDKNENEAEQQPVQKKYRGITEPDFYRPLYKKTIVLALIDGKIYTGILEGVDRFHLVMQTKQGLTLFTKHSIKYVYAAKKTQPEN